MKILHTSDWHLGKRLGAASRLPEQREVLYELIDLCEAEKVDVVLLAGDVFDTFVPPAEAEELFYECAVKLAAGRLLVAIPGNHDDEERLAAPSPVARACNIVIAGGLDNACFTRPGVTGGEGWLRVERGGERLNLALLPFPSESRVDGLTSEGKTYAEKVSALLSRCAAGFGDGINVTVSHLFMDGSEREVTDERVLGTATILPLTVLPAADYTALGHIHKPYALGRDKRVRYSGSILQYSFDDTTEKSVTLIETEHNKIVSVRTVPIRAGRRLVRLTAHSAAEAEALLMGNPGKFVEILYESEVPLTPSDTAAFRKYDCFNKVTPVHVAAGRAAVSRRIDRTPAELFEAFYQRKFGGAPDKALTELFVRTVEGEK